MSEYTIRFVASLVLAAAAAFPVAATAVEPCLATAAGDYGIPVQILDAMRVESAEDRPKNQEIAAREFGPMGLGEAAIQAGAKATGISAERVKTEACANYRVAAWFLDRARRKAGGDIWSALRTYKVGDSKSTSAAAISDQYLASIKRLAGER